MQLAILVNKRQTGDNDENNPFGENPAGNMTVNQALQAARVLHQLGSEMDQMRVDAALQKTIRESVVLHVEKEKS